MISKAVKSPTATFCRLSRLKIGDTSVFQLVAVPVGQVTVLEQSDV